MHCKDCCFCEIEYVELSDGDYWETHELYYCKHPKNNIKDCIVSSCCSVKPGMIYVEGNEANDCPFYLE